jgi:hypothetical protein
MKSIKKVFAATLVTGFCMLAGCAASAQSGSRTQPVLASDPTPAPASSPDQPSTLPPGHPAIGSSECPVPPSPGDSSLPPGHPAIDSTGATTGTSVHASEVGTLTIHAIQGTPGAAAAGADPVSIDFVVRGQLLDHMATHLNAVGALEITGLPVRFGIQPIVKITHAGVVFTTAGDVMDPDHASLKLDVPIFESTDQTPPWSVTMRHVIIQSSTSGIDVTEMLSIQSTGDRAWIGKADAIGQRTTFSLTLPPAAKDLKIGGALDTAAVSVTDNKLISKQPLIPGEDRYELHYLIPAVDNKAVLAVTAPASVGHLLVFVPEDGTTVEAPGLQAMGTQQLDEKGPKTRCFIATSLTQGQTITLTVGSLSASSRSVQPVSSSIPAPNPIAANSIASKAIAVGGAVAILLVGTMITLFKSPKTTQVQKKR